MTQKPLRPCRSIGCTAITRDGYCDKHKPDWRARDHEDSNQWRWLYRTREWRRLREQQLLEEPFCRVCAAQGVRTRATEVDHITPHKGSRYLFSDRANHQSLCRSCHSRKTMTELRESFQPSPHPKKV